MLPSLTQAEITPYTGKMVRIDWMDPVGMADGWTELEEALGLRPLPCFTLGVILRVVDDCVIIAGSGGVDEDSREYGDLNSIPTRCVTRVQELHVP